MLERLEEAMSMRRDVYSGTLKLHGDQHPRTLLEANNYASILAKAGRYKEARSLLRKTIPVTRRVLGESHELTLKMRWIYAMALYDDADASLDDQREAVTKQEELARTARRVLGGAHPLTVKIEGELRKARAALRARETPSPRTA